MNRAFWKEAVVYQIYPRSYQDSNGDGIGDLRGIISRLDYLKKLGVDVVWLSPVYKSPNDDNGYDISDYEDIMDEFGTLQDWEELLAGLHERGIKLMMDLVINHSSDEHAWFVESRSSKDNPYRDYYIWRPGGPDGGLPNNWSSIFSGPAWEMDETTGEYYLHLFSRKQPDLNWENPKLREALYKMMTFWLDKGVDGLRMDVINMISKVEGLPSVKRDDLEPGRLAGGGEYYMNGPRVHEYLQEMNREVLSKYDVMTVGETPGASVEDAILYTAEDRKELQMVFQFEHMDIDSGPGGKWEVTPWSLKGLRDILHKWQVGLAEQGWNSLYLNNHDQPRMVSRFGHDGEYRVQSAKMLATLLHTLKGTPYIYQGEEIGMTNVKFPVLEDYKDIEILNMYREKVTEGGGDHDTILKAIHAKGRDNARTPMQWDDSANAGFTEGTPWLRVNPNYKDINVEQALADPDSVFYYYQKLITLRKENLIMAYGEYELLLPEDESVYAYTRKLDDAKWLVLLNFSDALQTVQLPDELASVRETIISNYPDEPATGERDTLRPYEARVYRLGN
ncbi:MULTISPECIES: alpha-glucosidase [unclassified Paenibacillus]|uniref:glycoside hydrolase family 13 protein n=1 Tax=unclassified Paenibacillus TaxID=185978 RepID=UPI0024049B16|nr:MULTISPECIES: alpha-glucosidase [unclassified Paenibacillus]MDF9841794.1 oligo-1,6-glucosidase [Paenibacillus sp. PastF-2]MDF9848525.1 oligo-1,6-glucosidase [Paenibacillus sp. PastM-2]MDF9854954.1 oligo-1,6-glucosidase [Paenibacillus sp. PastF-1]MDH6480223.1 oligo-1,6-glucosidase [Paenibacillus sp. PastH-2]MDH6507793.1 oligo-1,6-glucosidase [Paenibacillus sp. PastM-3]